MQFVGYIRISIYKYFFVEKKAVVIDKLNTRIGFANIYLYVCVY